MRSTKMKPAARDSLCRDRSGQIRLTETVAVLFIFFILIMFGIIFYFKFSQVSLAQKSEAALASRAIDTTTRVLFLPELICSKGSAEPEDNCLDVLKLEHVNETFSRHLVDYYFSLFSYARIAVHEVYPIVEAEGPRSWVLYDRPKEDFTGIEYTYFVVTLRDERLGRGDAAYGYGYIEVGVYS